MIPERDDHGVSAAVRNSPLAALLDTPMDESAPTHLTGRSSFGFDKPWCGADGHRMSDADGYVTCPQCKVEADRLREHEELRVLKAIRHPGGQSLARLPKGTTKARWRLESKGEAVVVGPALKITDLGRARLRLEVR